MQQGGVQGEFGGEGKWGRGAGGLSLERAKRARKTFEGCFEGEVAGTVLGVPQHPSLFSSVADISFPTSSVPIFSLHWR